jgi:hypothetical protein
MTIKYNQMRLSYLGEQGLKRSRKSRDFFMHDTHKQSKASVPESIVSRSPTLEKVR